MSHLQIKKGKVANFRATEMILWQLLVTCTEFALSSYGKFIGNCLSNKHF